MAEDSWRRYVNRWSALILIMVGMIVVFAPLVVDDATIQIVLAAAGAFVILMGVWYTTHPLTDEREYVALREEHARFGDLVRQLNHAATGKLPPEDLDRTRAEMHTAVDKMVEVAAQRKD